jgi:hypothetical protein
MTNIKVKKRNTYRTIMPFCSLEFAICSLEFVFWNLSFLWPELDNCGFDSKK